MKVVSDHAAIVPGESVLIGVTYTIQPKWHIYWRNAGDTGAPTELSVKAPKGFTVGPVMWPRPHIFTEQGDVSFGYETKATLFVRVETPLTIDAEKVTFHITSEWLVCKGICKFGETQTSLAMPVLNRKSEISQRGEPFVSALKRIPKPLTALNSAKASIVDGSTLRIEGPSGTFQSVSFLPDHTPGVRYEGTLPHRGRMTDGRFLIEVPLVINPGDALGQTLRAAGVVVFGKGNEDPAYDLSITIPDVPRP